MELGSILKIFDLHKLPVKALLAVLVTCSAIVFVPKEIGYIETIIIFTSTLIITYFIIYLRDRILIRKKRKRKERKLKKDLQELDDTEKDAIIAFYNEGRNALPLTFHKEAISSLLKKGIIKQLPNPHVGRPQYEITEKAKAYLNDNFDLLE